jgi:hypothetical protein
MQRLTLAMARASSGASCAVAVSQRALGGRQPQLTRGDAAIVTHDAAIAVSVQLHARTHARTRPLVSEWPHAAASHVRPLSHSLADDLPQTMAE